MGSNPTVTAMRKASISAESRGNRGLRHSPIGTVTGAPETVDRYGRLDVLVNNAAAPQGDDRADIEEVPVSTFDRVVAINLRGTYLMCLAAVPVMRRQRYGRIINIESMAGVEGGAPADSAPETKGVTVSTM
ncbi:MAG TPA: hypothetical protein DIS91_07500 [Microbacterium sp.]|nr:hypothetical protein [Microbacterium sp.]HIE61896.1 SDR family oxidoreductase [Microbacterium sp.]